MRDDIETLLREAGDDPTRPLDLGEVVTRGARRATARRVGAGAGALVVVAALAVGVPQLVPDRDAPIIGETPGTTAPTGDPTPGDPTPTTAPAPIGAATPTEDPSAATSVTGVGATLATVAVVDGGVRVTLTEPDGTTSSYTTTSAPAFGVSDAVVVDGAGRAVYVDEEGTLTRADAASTAPVRSVEEGPWRVLGTTADGDVLVARSGELDEDEVLVLTDTDVVAPTTLGIVPGDGPLVTAPAEEVVGTASADDGRLVAATGIGDSTTWVEAVGGAFTTTYRSATMPFVTWRSTPTLVDGELWAVQRRAVEDGAAPDATQQQDLVLRAGEDDELVLPLPLGRELDGYVAAITVGTTADGEPAALLSVSTDDGRVTLLVDVAAARAGSSGAVTQLDVDGDVRFLG